MNYLTVQEKITAIHNWTAQQKKKVNSLLKTATTEQQKIMLKAKGKAYLDVMCFLQDKYSKYLLPSPLDKEKS